MAPPTAPPPLPPSVEESYRRKCIALRHRMNEVEDANEASNQRLLRMRRGIEKMRLERAFLLEQLAKRTSTNVEDSDGSPSPPSTPKEKPLRTKRGHRKPSYLANLDHPRLPSTAFPQAPAPPTLSPSNSDAFSVPARALNGHTRPAIAAPSTPPRRPRNGFEVFVSDMRSVLMVQYREQTAAGTFDVDEELARRWQQLTFQDQAVYVRRFEEMEEREEERRRWDGEGVARTSEIGEGDERGGEDVEMEDEAEDESE